MFHGLLDPVPGENERNALDLLEMIRAGRRIPFGQFLKDPKDSAPGWYLCMPYHYNTSLDIRYVYRTRTENNKVVEKWKEWKQGGMFSFNEGALIYDPLRYAPGIGCGRWIDTLWNIDFFVEIMESKGVTLTPDKKRDPGRLVFREYKVKKDTGRPRLDPADYTTTQDGFVYYAITGKLPQWN